MNKNLPSQHQSERKKNKNETKLVEGNIVVFIFSASSSLPPHFFLSHPPSRFCQSKGQKIKWNATSSPRVGLRPRALPRATSHETITASHALARDSLSPLFSSCEPRAVFALNSLVITYVPFFPPPNKKKTRKEGVLQPKIVSLISYCKIRRSWSASGNFTHISARANPLAAHIDKFEIFFFLPFRSRQVWNSWHLIPKKPKVGTNTYRKWRSNKCA